ncbi:MAG: tripartite tricarboxylate transporter substrate binding protein [Burkholderiaceae bacterium]|jgi:tripartite-type tricarboxylate transporter receptor subunit TctC|nr:tripartite tricarboxylate transporter substrate binding protein [Burkholderiaceae bacterium]MDP4969582.1 tripartite tricarboxylate transporter substrate binding protein [Burkholderiaceae bacterium]MDP5112237.1 tripartite tricarboxylate transporter substrate binding protein [Burkholderiaceae bacterium]
MKQVIKKLSRLSGVALLAAAAWSGSALAQYPTKPITVIIAYAPGGGTDLIGRLIAPYIEKYLGNNARLVITNRPGAGGGIGFAEIAKAKPDGYTIGFINTPNMLSIPIERPSTFGWQSYDLIGNLIDDPGAFTVNTSSSITNLKELAAYAKANPGKVTVGSTGIGSDDHLAMMFFERASGVKMTHVPYKGSGDMRGAIVSGQVTVGAINVGEALAYIKGGSPIRMIGQMSAKRTVLAPNMPTFAEQGYNIESASLRGMAAPKGLPPEIREKLVTAVAKAAADPEYIKKAGELFAPIRYLAPKEYAVELQNTDKQLRQLWKEAPWKE